MMLNGKRRLLRIRRRSPKPGGHLGLLRALAPWTAVTELAQSPLWLGLSMGGYNVGQKSRTGSLVAVGVEPFKRLRRTPTSVRVVTSSASPASTLHRKSLL